MEGFCDEQLKKEINSIDLTIGGSKDTRIASVTRAREQEQERESEQMKLISYKCDG